MPFIGARSRTGKFQINAKVYGPDSKFLATTSDVLVDQLSTVSEIVMDRPGIAKTIASRLVQTLSFDPNVSWVECEVLHESGTSFGDVAMVEDN